MTTMQTNRSASKHQLPKMPQSKRWNVSAGGLLTEKMAMKKINSLTDIAKCDTFRGR